MKRIIVLMILFWLIIDLAYAENIVSTIRLQKCPQKTQPLHNAIIFVGKLDDLGNDRFVRVWFEFGTQKNRLDKKTPSIKLNKTGIFCLRVNNLKKCENYYYRAVAQNSKGISYGEIKNIKTKCK